MWFALGVTVIVGGALMIKSFRSRHEPEPSNNRLKLPTMLICFAASVMFVVVGIETVLFTICGVLSALEAGFVMAGRNPWWMQAPLDKKADERYQAGPPRDLDPSG
jgi:hypothetical protein